MNVQNIKEVDDYLEKKISQNSGFIIFTFYELRISLDLSLEDTFEFLRLVSIKFVNNNYKVYRTGQEYNYNGKKKVKENELLIAIKKP